MMPDTVLVKSPSIDFRTFIGLGHKVLGRSPSATSDACRRELSDAERFLSCLAAMRDERAPVGLSPHLLKHVSFSAFIGADERDMLEILQLAGMPFVVVDTIVRGVQAAELLFRRLRCLPLFGPVLRSFCPSAELIFRMKPAPSPQIVDK
jgi:hypothetical protein